MIVIGFVLSMPVGPVSSLVVRATLVRGGAAGVAAGCGAALADAFYGAFGVVGVTLPIAAWFEGRTGSLVVGLALLALAAVFARSRIAVPVAAEPSTSPAGRHLASAFGSTLALQLVNPGAAPIVAALLAAVRPAPGTLPPYGVAFVALACGALLWWIVLVAVLGALRTRGVARLAGVARGATTGLTALAAVLALVRAAAVR